MTTIPVQWLLVFYVANQVASALIQSLPVPTTASSGWYVFIYKFMNLLIADFKSFTANLPPPGIAVGVKAPERPALGSGPAA
jgi:hypothetical protein